MASSAVGSELAAPLTNAQEELREQASPEQAPEQASPQEPPAQASSPWELHLGPITVKSGEGWDKLKLRPQWKLGGTLGNVKAEAGISDVRDGLKFDWDCKAFADVKSSGHSLSELHDGVRQKISSNLSGVSSAAASSWKQLLGLRGSTQQTEAMWAGAGEALENAQRILAAKASEGGSKIESIAQSLGLDVADLNAMLAGTSTAAQLKAQEPPADPLQAAAAAPADPPQEAAAPEVAQDAELMTLCVRVSAGLGLSAEMKLGWRDTSGYHMVGIGGSALAGVAFGGKVFAGWHDSGVGMRVVLGIGNFTFEYHFPRAVKPERFSLRQSSRALPAAA